jgi:hypothetical protein
MTEGVVPRTEHERNPGPGRELGLNAAQGWPQAKDTVRMRGDRTSLPARAPLLFIPPGDDGQNSAAPREAISAGSSVSTTARQISTVAASPGPKTRKNERRATNSPPVAAATVSPATSTSGATATAVRRAASTRGLPAARSCRSRLRKNKT